MSRETKFRAWLPGIRKMSYPMNLNELIRFDTDGGSTESFVWLQHTGLKDMKGNLIYEDDVLGLYGEFDEGRFMYAKSRVIFVDGCFTIADDMNYTDPIPISQWLEDGGSAVEVLGNIYENAELLQKDGDSQ